MNDWNSGGDRSVYFVTPRANGTFPLESPNGGWVGLSEIAALPNGKLAIVERDNRIALDARDKRLYSVDPGR
jgi:hypothetical protein